VIRLDTVKWLVIGLLVLLVLASDFLLSRRHGQSSVDWEAGQFCVANYRHAHTNSDSAIVDAQTPIPSRGQASVALNCGTMRKAGQLK
jgi:hypothetical protein